MKTTAKRRVNGICTRCGKAPAIAGQSRCGVCRITINRARKELRASLVAQGICVECGGRNTRVKGQICERCLLAYRNQTQRRTNHRRRNSLCVACATPSAGRRFCGPCAKVRSDRLMVRYHTLKAEVFAAMGCRCACCNESETLLLQIDHVKDDGKRDRQVYGRGDTYRLYQRVKREGYPRSKYQLLCVSCNWGKHVNGGVCPHQSARMREALAILQAKPHNNQLIYLTQETR